MRALAGSAILLSCLHDPIWNGACLVEECCWCRNVCICRWQPGGGRRIGDVPNNRLTDSFQFRRLPGIFDFPLITLGFFLGTFPQEMTIVLKAMMLRTADHLRVGQRFRALLSTLIEEWGVNTLFERRQFPTAGPGLSRIWIG